MLDVSKMVDAVLDVIDKPLRALHERVKAIETVEAETLPPDLVERLKSATEALAEPTPVPHVASIAPPQQTPRSVTGTVITRSGELAVSYSDGSSERLGSVIGPQGERGAQGEPGRDGIGMKGEDGPPGRDGVSVTATAINRDGELTMTLSDGSVLSPGIVAPKRK